MKLDMKLPGGGEIHFEKKPMSEDALSIIGMFLSGLFGLFAVWGPILILG